MNNFLLFAIVSSVIAIVYGLLLARLILKKSPGNARMQEIAKAIQEGAQAYLNKQYNCQLYWECHLHYLYFYPGSSDFTSG